MKKSEAVQEFGTKTKLARAIGIGQSAISNWPEDEDGELSDVQRDRVQAALFRRLQDKPKRKEKKA